MKKFFRLAIALIVLMSVSFMNVNHIAWAQVEGPGTVPIAPEKITTADGGELCVGTACAYFNHKSIPGSGYAGVSVIQQSRIEEFFRMGPPGDTYFVADGIDVRIYDKNNNQVIYFAPPVKVCFAVRPGWDGVVRYWATAAYLESMGRTMLPGQTGDWIALPTFIDTVDWPGAYCAWAYEPGAYVAVGGYIGP
ncbi:MAG: hypothetical protein KKE82_14235 [Proteobacteria bacterium]|nr:hypothetical protein [Pseudomonadota bacterium]